MLGTAALSANGCKKKPESFISTQHCLCLSGHCHENGLVYKIGGPHDKSMFKLQGHVSRSSTYNTVWGQTENAWWGNPLIMSVPSALSGPSFPHKRRNKDILPPYPNSVPSPHLQVSLPLNAWFQQSHGAKEQGRLILWPSCLTKQTLYFSWERKKSSRHLGKQTLKETDT